MMCTYFTLSSFRLSKINKEAADLALQMCFLMVTIILEELRLIFFIFFFLRWCFISMML